MVISLGQAFLRQLPFFAQFFFIDALFALFTERRQRAFELLTRTRTVAENFDRQMSYDYVPIR